MTFDLEKTIRYWHEGAKYESTIIEFLRKPVSSSLFINVEKFWTFLKILTD